MNVILKYQEDIDNVQPELRTLTDSARGAGQGPGLGARGSGQK